ncbi:periplasmic binding protein-like I [Blastocladiella britannica]|nr:periplasmic binding protein-like I [Blastocladiella britannica]
MTVCPRRRAFVVAVLALALIAQLAHAATFKIAVALPMTGALSSLGVSITTVLQASVKDVNKWAASVPTGPGTTPHSIALMTTADTVALQAPGVKAVFDASSQGAVALIGDLTSANTIPMDLSAQNFNLWHCSGSVTSPDLSDKSMFPKFFRTIPNDALQGIAIARFIQSMGWQSCAVLYSSDAYGTGMMGTLTAEAQRLSLPVRSSQSYTPAAGDGVGDAKSYTAALTAIQSSATRIIVFIGAFTDYVQVARIANSMDMIGNGWVWIGTDGVASVASNVYDTTKPFTDEDRSNTNGLLISFPLENANTKISQDFINSSGLPAKNISDYTMFFHDCLMGLARGLVATADSIGEAAVLNRTYPSTVNLGTFLKQFPGVTGDVKYDEKGDRVGAFTIANVFAGNRTQVWTVTQSDSDKTKSEVKMIANAPLKFFDGTSTIPKSEPVSSIGYLQFTSIGGLAILALLGLMALTIIVTNIYLFQNRTHVAIKNMSLPFLTMISCGLLMVLAAQALWLDVPSAMSCQLETWFFLLGLELVLSAVAAKAYRIWRIFDNKTLSKLHSMSNARLMMGCMVFVFIQAMVLCAWTFMSPLKPKTLTTVTLISYECASENAAVEMAFKTISLLFNGILLVVLAFLAYKTRKAYSSFRESVFISYAIQNIFLCGIVISPLLYINKATFPMPALLVKMFVTMYAVSFSFGCLVGRIALVLLMSNKTDLGIKMSMDGGSSSADGTSSAEHIPGKASTLTGKYPVKVANRLFETWHTHRLTLFALEGFLGLTRLTNNTEQGKLFRLRSLQFDPTPANYPLCIELRADSAAFLVQFAKEDDKAKWVRALSVHCLVHSKSTATRSSGRGGATGGGQGSTIQVGGATYSVNGYGGGNGGAVGMNSTAGQQFGRSQAGGGGGNGAPMWK